MGWGLTVILAPDEQCHHKERQRIESTNQRQYDSSYTHLAQWRLYGCSQVAQALKHPL